MPDYRATVGMLSLVRQLEATRSGAIPVNDLATELRVHRRTVLRWLGVLEQEFHDDGGHPVVRREHRRGRAWAVLVGARAPLSASIFQYAAAFAAVRHLDAVQGSILAESASDVLSRVEAGLPASLKELVPRVERAFHYVPFAPKDYRGAEELLDTLVQSLIRRVPVDVRYTSAKGRTSRQTLHPWSLVMYRDGFYVLARPARRRELLLYAVERIAEATLLGRTGSRSRRTSTPTGSSPGTSACGGPRRRRSAWWWPSTPASPRASAQGSGAGSSRSKRSPTGACGSSSTSS